MKYDEYGRFSEDESGYIITERKTPRHWYNYFYNEHYVSFASQVGFGEGFAEDYLGRRLMLTADRCVYVSDKESGVFHTAVGLPMTEKFDGYRCEHRLGSTTILCEKNGIRTEFTIYVPDEGCFEQWIVKVTNLCGRERRLSVIGYDLGLTDNAHTPQGYNSESAHFDEKNGLIYSTALSPFESGKQRVFYPYFVSDGKLIGYDTRYNAFIGTYGSKETPEALLSGGGCTCSETYVEKICFSLENECDLGIGETKTVCFKVGFAREREEFAHVRDTLEGGMAEKLLNEVLAERKKRTAAVRIDTPDEKLNKAFEFYKYAAAMGSRWARVRHNGYRDRVSDSEALSAVNPALAWKRFRLALEYQYASGYAPRTVIDGAIRPNNFADCAVWITMTAHSIVCETGDLRLLDEVVKFNDGSEATVFEHLRRAIEYLYAFKGENGLIRIWGGDWNDGMNLAGLEGKGVSVWLSIAWCRANKLFIELALMRGEDGLAAHHGELEKEMEALIEKYGWDGRYYLTAINDKGEKIGSHECRYGKMYLNPQIWAVFSGIASPERQKAIFEQVDAYLETPLGTLVNRPGYAEPDGNIGIMTFRPVGSLINGGVYMHPMAWKIAAEAMLKRPEKLSMTLKKILPWNHEYAMTYGEPYILYNMYHGPETGYRFGTPGQSWRTASSQVLMRNLVRFVFGLAPDPNGMKLQPVLPPEWKECGITKEFRGCRYEIRYHQGETHTCTVERIEVDGEKSCGEYLPCEAGKTYKVDVFVK